MKVYREFEPADRYLYDFGLCSAKNGFAQIDTEQDASYFGTWANPTKLVVFNYCEGDCTTTVCDNAEEFKQELQSIADWNIKNGYKAPMVDAMCRPEIEAAFLAMGINPNERIQPTIAAVAA